MTEETSTPIAVNVCGCDTGGACPHQEETKETSLVAELRKHRGSEEIAFAFLLALTPLAVLTFFGQVGLI